MQVIDLYRLRVTDRVSGRRHITRSPMSKANAKDLDPQAERIEGTNERTEVRRAVLPPSAQRFQATRQ